MSLNDMMNLQRVRHETSEVFIRDDESIRCNFRCCLVLLGVLMVHQATLLRCALLDSGHVTISCIPLLFALSSTPRPRI